MDGFVNLFMELMILRVPLANLSPIEIVKVSDRVQFTDKLVAISFIFGLNLPVVLILMV